MFHRIKARRGWAKAVVAVAHKVLVIAYQMLKDRTPYHELGGDYYDRINPEKMAKRLVARLERLGYTFAVPPLPPSPLPPPTSPEPPAVAALADPSAEPTNAPPKRKRGRPRKYPPIQPPNTSRSIG